jgi:hypothetical protein
MMDVSTSTSARVCVSLKADDGINIEKKKKKKKKRYLERI